MVRGYAVAYGIGTPYDHRHLLDNKQSSLVIRDLRKSCTLFSCKRRVYVSVTMSK